METFHTTNLIPASATPSLDAVPAPADDDRIKRPLNSFMVWAKATRRLIKAEFPALSSSEISKKLGVEWRRLTEAEKKPFVEGAKRLRAEHMSLHPDYKFTTKRRRLTLLDVYPERFAAMALEENTQPAATTVEALMPVPYAFAYGDQNGLGVPVQDQMGYYLQQGVNDMPTPMYAFNSFQYDPMMAPAHAYMSSPYVYSAATPYDLHPVIAVPMGTVMPGVAPDYLPPPVVMTPHFQTVSGDLFGIYTPHGGGNQYTYSPGSHGVHIPQNGGNEVSGYVSQALL